jgi:hypothetical protein
MGFQLYDRESVHSLSDFGSIAVIRYDRKFYHLASFRSPLNAEVENVIPQTHF